MRCVCKLRMLYTSYRQQYATLQGGTAQKPASVCLTGRRSLVPHVGCAALRGLQVSAVFALCHKKLVWHTALQPCAVRILCLQYVQRHCGSHG